MAILKQVTTLTSVIINNCTPPNITPILTLPTLMVSVGPSRRWTVQSYKRKTQQSDRRAHKRLRVLSMLPSREDSFTTLRSHFTSVPLDDRLQFLSWLFKGALPHCMSSSSLTACEETDALATSCSSTPHEIDQNRRDRRKARGGSRKNMPWSTEEAGLLLKLKKEKSRSWSEVARLFSERYPGRTLGATQTYDIGVLNRLQTKRMSYNKPSYPLIHL